MRHIEDLRDRHKGEEIWIIGCHPSLDDVPSDFFNGRISIALGFTVVAFPGSTYATCFHKTPMEFFQEDLDLLKRAILYYPNEIVGKPEDWKYGEYPIWMAQKGHGDKGIMRAAVRAIRQARSVRYSHRYTHAHLAIQAAAILGATRISLVACQHKYSSVPYAQKRGLSKFYHKHVLRQRVWNDTKEGLRMRQEASEFQEEGTAWLAEALSDDQGVVVERYDLEKGYISIPKKEDRCLPS